MHRVVCLGLGLPSAPITKRGFVCLQLIRAQCVQYQSQQKRRRSLNLARIEKCQKERWHYFSILRGLCFLTFFDTSKTGRAVALPSFSDKPHAIKDDMGGHGVAISCSLMIFVWPSIQARGCEQLSLKYIFKLLTMLVRVHHVERKKLFLKSLGSILFKIEF